MIILFFTRLFLYVLVFSIPIVHPAIVVPFDLNGWMLWFFLVPAQMTIAFFLTPPNVKIKTTLFASAVAFIIAFLISSGGNMVFLLLGGGLIAFVLTIAVFKTKTFGRNIALAEQFFLAFIYYRLISFSRASEEMARIGRGMTQLLLALIVCSFLIHALVLYFAAFPSGNRRRARREWAFLGLLAPLLLVVSLIMPPDYLEHSIVFNPIDEDVVQPFNDYDGKGWENGNGGSRRNGDRHGEREGQDSEGGLQGIPSDKWSDQLSRSGAKGKQYSVMIVISEHNPIYSAESYYSDFHPRRGFLYEDNQPLNELTYIRLLETWQDGNPPEDKKRYPVDIRYISTLSERVHQYRPYIIEPTVLNMEFHPFDFLYHVISRISFSNQADWRSISGLSDEEKRRYQKYLQIPLNQEDKEVFQAYLNKAVDPDAGYYQKIKEILEGFKEYQYELGFDDSVDTENLVRFLSETKSGDCTEFSNTAAVLGRLVGIPSRVVTGYLASKGLQTNAHRWGLQELRKVIPQLKEIPLEHMFLVTTAHHHSWVQYYMPAYGWVDFETTAQAIPPPPGGDPNSRNVVIPIIQDVRQDEDLFVFPWRFILNVFLLGAGTIVAALYLFRYGKQLYLARVSNRNDERGIKALYTLLLMKKAADGYEVKKPHMTPQEYAERYPELKHFAELYTTLRYKEVYRKQERERLLSSLRTRYTEVARMKRRGPWAFLRRMFNLKGLHY